MIKKFLLVVFCICLIFTIPAFAGGGHHGPNCGGGGDDGGGDTGGGNDDSGTPGPSPAPSNDTGGIGGPGDISSQDPNDPCDTYTEFINNHCKFIGFRSVPNN